MSRSVLVTDIDTHLGNELVRLYLEAGHRVVATSGTEEALSSFGSAADESLAVVRWNRNSPASARNMVLKTLNTFDGLDELVLLGPDRPTPASLVQTTLADIEALVDNWIKGSLFLLRETLEHFERRAAGVVAMILPADTGDSPMASTLHGAFASLCEGLLRRHTGAGSVVVNGYATGGQDIEGFAEFIMMNLAERGRIQTGRWFRFQSGILSGFRGRSRR
jgi:NAD(P)-dependent dehydrogenase (short-subunit alcohol dehydrogenase family)